MAIERGALCQSAADGLSTMTVAYGAWTLFAVKHRSR
jgi:hypothetical protein